MGFVYLIRDNETGLHKIGMTTDWERRSRQLKVGISTTQVRVVRCEDAEKWEKVLHAMFKHRRIPQSEWFRISAEEAIPKMTWLVEQTTQRRMLIGQMVIGRWKQAKDGHFYRRRKSSSGNWYTEQQTALAIRQCIEAQLELAIVTTEREKTQESRTEPGYWPTKEDPSKVEWAEKDPTYTPSQGCLGMAAILILGLFGAAFTQQPIFLLIAGGIVAYNLLSARN